MQKMPVVTHKLDGQFVKQVASSCARMQACSRASKPSSVKKLQARRSSFSESFIFQIRACAAGGT